MVIIKVCLHDSRTYKVKRTYRKQIYKMFVPFKKKSKQNEKC